VNELFQFLSFVMRAQNSYRWAFGPSIQPARFLSDVFEQHCASGWWKIWRSKHPTDDRGGEPGSFVIAVADRPRGASRDTECARKFIKRSNSIRLGGLGKLLYLCRLPAFISDSLIAAPID
jgi:hypothetical protein